MKRVYANKGAGGVDGVTVQQLEEYMATNWNRIKQEIRERNYKPQPVLRVGIPKANGGVRKLGIPTVVDRIIEQAIIKLLEYFNEGYLWIVDIDLEKFFDNVPPKTA